MEAALKTLSHISKKITKSKPSALYYNASNISPGDEAGNLAESSLEKEETVQENPSAMLNVPVCSTSEFMTSRESLSFPVVSTVPTDGRLSEPSQIQYHRHAYLG